MQNEIVSLTDQKTVVQESHINPLTVYASECHKLMMKPQRLKDGLAQTTKTWLKEEAVAQVLGLRKTVVTRQIIKGLVCEGKSIDLYNHVMKTNYPKNSKTIDKYGFRGTPDLITDEGIVEIKTSWDATTFPFFRDDLSRRIKKAGYDWQCRVYMMLFDIDRAVVSYCLVDTPQSDLLLDRWDNTTLHRFDGIVEEKKRVTVSEIIERDLAIEQKMKERYALANIFYKNYLEELYNK